MTRNDRLLTEELREAFIARLLEAHEDAGIRGLCGEGRFEAAVNALRLMDLAPWVDGRQPAPEE